MADGDIDCMIEQIFDPERTAGMDADIGSSPEALDGFAAECDIDTSKLYYVLHD